MSIKTVLRGPDAPDVDDAEAYGNLLLTGTTAGSIPILDETGKLPEAVIPSVSADVSNLNADNLTSGTIPDARFPAQLPAIDGSLLTGIAASGGGATVVRKTASQDVESEIPANDTELLFAIGANETWVATFNLQLNASNMGGARFAVAIPAGASYQASVFASDSINYLSARTTTVGASMTKSALSGVTNATINVSVENGATPGNVQLLFGQDTPMPADPVTMYEGSFLVAHQIA